MEMNNWEQKNNLCFNFYLVKKILNNKEVNLIYIYIYI